ncbi:MAG: hypothetical protein A3B41_03595 [Candidatus Levybacteria bacterium RIFCSPLOWO2_01_FULL_37_26]|nr:MAG: hypothetical protein A3B41_03595 [Candidatus Levybacteria bacterium RIFCSPLOWO2_01_FULL_37_26]
MINYKNAEAVMLLTQAVPEAEGLVLDAMKGRLTPDQFDQVLGICGASSPEEALRVIRNQRNALVKTVVVNEN